VRTVLKPVLVTRSAVLAAEPKCVRPIATSTDTIYRDEPSLEVKRMAQPPPPNNTGRYERPTAGPHQYLYRDFREPSSDAATFNATSRAAAVVGPSPIAVIAAFGAAGGHPSLTRDDSGVSAAGHARAEVLAAATHPHFASRVNGAPPVERRGQLPDARFLIVDDCALHRENLAAVFVVHGVSKLSVAWNLPTLCSALSEATPEIVVVNMGSRDSVTLLRFVRQTCAEARVIVVGIPEDDEAQIIACAEEGVAGYHMRAESLDELLGLIGRVAIGEAVCSPRISAILLRRLSDLAAQRRPVPRELVLTAREAQILRMLEAGLSNRDIAAELCIAVHTVKNHVHSLLHKLGVSTRAEAAALSRTIRYTEDDRGN
jgi:DNA-binding NarL/FixJ family response regulator